jgi:hypothetical protein
MSDPIDDRPLSPAVALAMELRGFVGKLKRRVRDKADVGDRT